MQKLFDIKVILVAIVTAFGWGGNYFTLGTKLDYVIGKSETHVSREVFAQQVVDSDRRMSWHEKELADQRKAIQRIYERYGWERDK